MRIGDTLRISTLTNHAPTPLRPHLQTSPLPAFERRRQRHPPRRVAGHPLGQPRLRHRQVSGCHHTGCEKPAQAPGHSSLSNDSGEQSVAQNLPSMKKPLIVELPENPRDGRKNTAIWNRIDFSNTDAAIARALRVDARSVAAQRKKRGVPSPGRGGPRYPGKFQVYRSVVPLPQITRPL